MCPQLPSCRSVRLVRWIVEVSPSWDSYLSRSGSQEINKNISIGHSVNQNCRMPISFLPVGSVIVTAEESVIYGIRYGWFIRLLIDDSVVCDSHSSHHNWVWHSDYFTSIMHINDANTCQLNENWGLPNWFLHGISRDPEQEHQCDKVVQ